MSDLIGSKWQWRTRWRPHSQHGPAWWFYGHVFWTGENLSDTIITEMHVTIIRGSRKVQHVAQVKAIHIWSYVFETLIATVDYCNNFIVATFVASVMIWHWYEIMTTFLNQWSWRKKIIICITCIDLLCENEYNMSSIFNVVIPFNTLDRCPFKYELYRRFKIIYTLKMH